MSLVFLKAATQQTSAANVTIDLGEVSCDITVILVSSPKIKRCQCGAHRVFCVLCWRRLNVWYKELLFLQHDSFFRVKAEQNVVCVGVRNFFRFQAHNGLAFGSAYLFVLL